MNKKMKKSYTALWLSFICAFVLLFPANIFAGNGDNDANANTVKAKINLTKEVNNAVKQSPGKETFSFELVPAEGKKDLATAGITVDKNTVETNGVGSFDGTLNFSVDKSKINENNGWKAFGKNKKNYLISYTLQEKNDGKKGWEYGTKKYDVVMSYYPDDNAIYTSTYLPGTDAAETAKFENTFKGTELKSNVELTKEVKQDGKHKPGKEKFMFEMVPAEGQKDLATAGITVDTNTVETNGVGTFKGDLNYTVDANKISEANGWKAFGKDKKNYLISYTLQEKNDGKKGWEYGTKKYDVVMSYYPDDNAIYTSTYLPGTDAAETAKFENAFKGVEMPKPPTPPVEKFEIKVDPNGGNWDGKTDTMTYYLEKGTLFTLPKAPTKEGYQFMYWKGSEYKPGDRYEVKEDHTFTAVWKKVEEQKTTTAVWKKVEEQKTTEKKTVKNSPVTGDSSMIYIYAFGLLAAAGATFIIKNKKEKR